METNARSSSVSSRLACGMTVAAKHRSSDLWMKRYVVVLSAIVADDLETLVGVIRHGCRLFTSALGTTLRRHHIALVEHLLFLFSKQKNLLTLHTRNFYVRHRCTLLCPKMLRMLNRYASSLAHNATVNASQNHRANSLKCEATVSPKVSRL